MNKEFNPIGTTPPVEAGLSIKHGRIGEPEEYYEYSQPTNPIKYIAQKGASGRWFVFKVCPGKKGLIKTIANFIDDFSACKYAEKAIINRW